MANVSNGNDTTRDVPRFRVGLFFAFAAATACRRKDAPHDARTDAAIAAPDASAPKGALVTARDAGFEPASVEPVEARRLRVTNIEENRALFGDAAALLASHFGRPRGSFDVQIAPLTAKGRRMLFVVDAEKPASDARPMAVVVDAAGAVVWSKERPLAGIMPPVGPVAIAGAPLGRVALAACDPPTSVVALRLWDDDGSPFADFQVMTQVESCDALSLLYWPGHGWIVVAVRPGSTRGILVRESGSFAWERSIELGGGIGGPPMKGVRGRPSAATLAADTPGTFVLVQAGQHSTREGAPVHALAFRYDLRGNSLWDSAVDLGALPKAPEREARMTVAPLDSGVRVTLPSGRELVVRPNGEVSTRQ